MPIYGETITGQAFAPTVSFVIKLVEAFDALSAERARHLAILKELTVKEEALSSTLSIFTYEKLTDFPVFSRFANKEVTFFKCRISNRCWKTCTNCYFISLLFASLVP